MSRVLLTGASGFIGRFVLARLLTAGYEVHAVARRVPPPPATDGAHWHEVDLLDGGSLGPLLARTRPEHLLHLAWYAEPGAYWTAPENVQWVEATLALLRAFAASGGRRAVVAGTCAEYDWSTLAAAQGSPACHERDTPLGPSTLYGVAKHATHLVAESWAPAAGLDLAWGRIFFLFGPEEASTRLVPSIALPLLDERTAQMTSGTQIRDFLHVDDVAASLVALLDSAVVGPVNIASGQGVAVRDLAAEVAAAVGRPDLLRVGALPPRPGEPPVIVADTRRLRDEVGFRPRFSLPEAVADTVAQLRRVTDPM